MTQTCAICESEHDFPYSVCPDCAFKCRVCGEQTDGSEELHRHHTSYLFDTTIKVCRPCHLRIHNEPGYKDDLKPTFTREEAENMGLQFSP